MLIFKIPSLRNKIRKKRILIRDKKKRISEAPGQTLDQCNREIRSATYNDGLELNDLEWELSQGIEDRNSLVVQLIMLVVGSVITIIVANTTTILEFFVKVLSNLKL